MFAPPWTRWARSRARRRAKTYSIPSSGGSASASDGMVPALPGPGRGRTDDLNQAAAAHVVDEARHRDILGDERRCDDALHVIAHALLQVWERQKVDGRGVSAGFLSE